MSATDTTAALQTAGHVGIGSYVSGSSNVLPLSVIFDDLWVGSTTAAPPVDPPVNAIPVAAITSSTTGLTASVDGTGSTDSDGTISGYAWNFGDGGTATGATATHTYATAGTYTVTLTVTDNGGATGTTTKTVTVTAAPGTPAVLALDTFDRSAATGWGSANAGGAWTTSTPANYSVGDGVGKLRSAAAGALVEAYLGSVSSTATDLTVTTSIQQASTGGGTFVSAIGRRVGTQDYRARIVISPTGAVNLQLQRSGATLQAATIAGLSYTVGDQLQIRVQVTGTAPTTIRAKVWKVGATEPTTWRLTATDTTAALQVPGSIGVGSYLAGSATVVPLTTTFDNLQATVVP